MTDKPIWLYNGVAYPPPLMGYGMMASQFVKEGRNAKGELTIDRINRRMEKLNNVAFPVTTYDEMLRFRRAVEQMEVWITYWDLYLDRVNERKFYFGDFSVEIVAYEDAGAAVLKPSRFKSMKCNVIDMGVADRIPG
ncbi:MAG: hypothetical protein LBR76_02615 [Oscillospiraceae bacterium]|nr:hypothetical protein [Oscillospiraceae bacterium]